MISFCSGWVWDTEHEAVQIISNRISAITGLSLKTAEAFQVIGNEGNCDDHDDFNLKM